MTDGPLTWPRRASRRHTDARPGAPSDWLRVSWLVETSRRVYTRWGRDSLRELLAAPGGVVWQEGRALRGALLADACRGEVGEARLLVVHDDADLARFGDEVLPYAEERLAYRGTRWLSVSSPDAWVLDLLAPRGYALKDRVVTYVRPAVALDDGGNPDLAVRRALPDDLPGMLAVDAAAFEPFWRYDRHTMRSALDHDACVLVAQAPLPDSLRVLGGRVREGGSDAVIGYLLADVWEARAHIVRVGVAPPCQRRGVATRLIAEALHLLAPDIASQRSPFGLRAGAGVTEVTVNTQETNVRSRALYERLGFHLTGDVEEVWARELEHAVGRN